MLRTPVTDLLGIEHPILQAPMASAATPALAAAVSEAGGLGALGSSMLPADELRRQTAELREQTARPFQLNFFCHEPPEVSGDIADRAREYFAPLYDELGLGDPPQPSAPAVEFDEARLEALLELRPPVVSFHFGLPARDAMEAIHEAGMLVLASATTVAEARHLEEHGVDAVVAQGAEAGGHRGSFLVDGDDGPVGTLALVPQVVDAVDVPVIAAGGIADARGLAAVLALGAGAAQIGTAFLPCPESGISPVYREALRTAQADGTTVTRAVSGRPARALRNRLTQELSGVLPYPAQLSLTSPLFGTAGADFQAMWSGQAAALATESPAAEVVAAIAAGAEAIAGQKLLALGIASVPVEIVLARHGETEWSRDRRHTGRTDIPLTDNGRRQAALLRPVLGGRGFERVLSSPLSRALDTCREAGLGDRAELTDDLCEWDYGEYEGITTAEIRTRRPGWNLWGDGCPGGETATDVGRRVDRVIESLAGLEGDAALFAHGHVLRVLAARWLGLGPDAGALFKLDTGTLSALGYERETRVITLWNAPVTAAGPPPR